MKRILLVLIAGLALAGCAQLTKIQQVYTAATTTVSASYVLAAANSYEAAAKLIGGYYDYCGTARTDPRCAAATLRTVRKAELDGRAARNKLESYIDTGAPAPATLYNLLIDAVNTLNASPIGSVGAAK